MFLAPAFVFGQTGNHFGEQKLLTYRIEYLNPLGITMVDGSGITYIGSGYWKHEDNILPVKYFNDYPLYFTGGLLRFKLFVKNEGNRIHRNLKIETFQEFLNTESSQGKTMGDDNRQEWFLEKLGAGEEIILSGEFRIPSVGESGIDQTHLRISYNTPSDREKGEIILEDFQAGLWCPVKS